MSVKIVRPKNDSRLKRIGKNFAAHGRCGDGFTLVGGTCAPIPGPGSPSPDPRQSVTSLLIKNIPATGTSAQPPSFKWYMVFQGLQTGSYRLTALAKDPDNNTESDQVEFQVRAVSVGPSPPGHIRVPADIVSPSDGDTLPVDDFFAYGDAPSQVTVSLAPINPDGTVGSSVQGLVLFCDFNTLQFWSLMDPGSLPSLGSYLLQESETVSGKSTTYNCTFTIAQDD